MSGYTQDRESMPVRLRAPAEWPTGDPRLERDYRRLLLAYPRHYRRRHGSEIVTTLLEMAAPDQRRPGAREAAHLLASGVRQRFRLPTGRPLTWIAATLMALTMGAFGAAAGSWAGERTFAALPADAAVTALHERASGGAVAEMSTLRDGSPWSGRGVWTSSTVPAGWDAEQARQRFVADGWSVGPLTPLGGTAVEWNPETNTTIELPAQSFEFVGEAAGLAVRVSGFGTPRHGNVHLGIAAQRTPVFLPLIVAGTGLGLVAGWLLAAALAYRVRRAPAGRRRAAAGLGATALATLALPAVALYGNVMRAFEYHSPIDPVFTVHSAFTPGEYYPFGPGWLVPALSVAGAGVAAVAVLLARMARPQPREIPVAD